VKPLRGRTVLLTRPRSGSEDLAAPLRALGARIRYAPAIRIVPPGSWKPLDRELRRLAGYDAVVFTSANAVRYFFARARAVLGRVPPRPPEVWAIGPATARELARRGWRGGIRVPETHEGGALARGLSDVRGRRILIPRAAVARPVLPDTLRRRGAVVRVVPVYRNRPDPAGRRILRGAARDGGADWVTFTSGSTVDAFVKAIGAAGARRFFQKSRAGSIGPVTSAALRRHGIVPAAEALPATSAGLARAIAARSAAVPVPLLDATLRRALREAGAILRRGFGKVTLRYKGRADIVTESDQASERRILGLIRSRFPDHDYLAEESRPRATGSEYLWVIDPLDGTTNYAHGFPVCCVSIGLLHRGEPLLGGVYDPFRDELFIARRGAGTTLNGRRIRVSGQRRLEQSLLVTGFAYDRHKLSRYYLEFYRVFMERCHDVRRSGSAALDLAWVAAGRLDGYWEFHLKPWDVAAGMLLVREAGGTVTDFSGKPWAAPESFGHETLASNGRLHPRMLRLIRKNL